MAKRLASEGQLDIEFGRADGDVLAVSIRDPLSDESPVETSFRLPLSSSELAVAVEAVDGGQVDTEDARRIGRKLFEQLFRDERACDLLRDVERRRDQLHYRFVLGSAESAAVPWELLHDGARKRFLARTGAIVRWLAFDAYEPESLRAMSVAGPLRTLVVVASPPSAQPVLDVRSQVRAIRQAFARASQGVAAPVRVLAGATRRSLASELREARAEGRAFNVVHFVGHTGRATDSGESYLLLDGSDGQLSAHAFARMLDGGDVRLVVLTSGSPAGSKRSFASQVLPGFAHELIASAVPAVVGLQSKVLDSFAAEVVERFYEKLLAGRSLGEVVAGTYELVEQTGSSGPAEHGVPVAYIRSPGESVVRATPDRFGSWRRWRRWVWTAVIVVIPSLFTLAFGVRTLLDGIRGLPLEPMIGEFNVAVAGFTVLSADDTDSAEIEAQALASSLHAQLGEELTCGPSGEFHIDCRGPDDTEQVEGDSDQRAERAAKLAAELRADIVVYALVTEESGVLTVTPVVFVADRQLLNAQELAGTHELAPLSGPVRLANQRAEFRGRIEAQARLLSDLVFGLSFYATGDYQDALARIEPVVSDQAWELGDDLLHLLAGNLYGKLGRFADAERAYTAALDASPGYARARLGLAELIYVDALDEQRQCAEGAVDGARLAEASAAFEALANDEERATAAKGSFGVARVLLCQSLAGEQTGWAPAAERFEGVIAAYEDGRPELVEQAAESHASLALISLQRGDGPDAYRRALDELMEARDLSESVERRGQFTFLSYVAHNLLEDNMAACEDLRLTLTLTTDAAIVDAAEAAERELACETTG